MPSSLRNGAPPIPEEIRPVGSRHSSPGSNHSNNSAGDKEKWVLSMLFLFNFTLNQKKLS